MTARPQLGCVLNVVSYPDVLNVGYALVKLDEERVKRLVDMIENAMKQKQENERLFRICFSDGDGVVFFHYPHKAEEKRVREAGGSSELYKTIRAVKETKYFGQMVDMRFLPDLNRMPGGLIEVDTPVLNVYPGVVNVVKWEARDLATEQVLEVDGLSLGDLLFAELVYTSGKDLTARFERLFRLIPDVTVDLLETGLYVLGLGTLDIASRLDPEALLPLLEANDPVCRQKAITILGRLRGSRSQPNEKRRTASMGTFGMRGR